MIGAGLIAAGAGAVAALGVAAGEVFQIDLRRRWTTEVDLPEVCGYVAQQSTTAGDPIPLGVHGRGRVELSLARLSADGPHVVHTQTIEATPQSGAYDFWRGLDWPTIDIGTSSDWVSGLYLLELSQGAAIYRQAVVIKPLTTPDIAVVVSTNTWAAYNEFGGLSNYRDYASPQPLRLLKKVLKTMNWRLVVGNRRSVPALPLPFLRPNAAINEDLATLDADPVDYPSHLVRAEWAALRHFDRSDLSYGVYADSDIAFGGAPYKARLMIFTAHSEYWSEEMKGRFTSYLATGGRALFLSGNHWYRTVKFLEHGLEVVDDRVDPSVVAATLGSGYTADGYETYAPYRVVNADHPVFEGTGLAEGDHFAGPDDRGRGGSGYETDKVNMGSGLVDVLAVGDNVEGPAFMVWKEHPAGGWVCNFGSVASAPWLERCVFMASVVKNVVRLGVTEAP